MPRRSIVEHHGHSCGGQITPEYRAWMNMKRRCENKSDISYPLYGGRGISVCEKWRNSFVEFFKEIGRRPSKEYSLGRKDNEKDYEPGNVRWETAKSQARNRRSSLLVRHAGKEMSLAEACEKTDINYDAAKHRVKNGLPFNKAIRCTAQDYAK